MTQGVSMRILILQNHERCDADLMGDALRRRDVQIEIAEVFATDRLPDVEAFDAVMVFGSPASCLNLDDDPGLVRARDLVRRAVALEKPVLGVCFGGQLLAHVLGAAVQRAPVGEFGRYEIRLTAEGVRSPLFEGFPSAFGSVEYHQDTFDLPEGATLLASTDLCPHQAFVLGRSVGLQFHPESSLRQVSTWTAAYPEGPASVGKTCDEVLAEYRAAAAEHAGLCERLVDNFLRFATSSPARRDY